MYFPRDEYEQRWTKVLDAMHAQGYETLVVWQRSGGAFDRLGDLFWLANYASAVSGQESPSVYGFGRAFAALLFRQGQAPELHIAEEPDTVDLDEIPVDQVYGHTNLIIGLAGRLKELGVEGRVAYVGDDFLPALYYRTLLEATPGIEWVPEDTFLWPLQRIKSPRELDLYREAGEIATRALTAMMESLVGGESESEAAARAGAEVLRGGGGFHRIGIHHGPKSEHSMWHSPVYGFTTGQPKPGDIVRAWVYGPILHGYWLDPGRTSVVGAKPTPEQRDLIENCARIVEEVMAVIKPGVTTVEAGQVGDAASSDAGYLSHKQSASLWPIYGHGVGTFFARPSIPLFLPKEYEGEPKFTDTFEEGMTMGIEAFLTHPGVGTAGFEQNVIVVRDGVEVLTKSPMLFW
jgi:Xaa-Pro dipeptidase